MDDSDDWYGGDVGMSSETLACGCVSGQAFGQWPLSLQVVNQDHQVLPAAIVASNARWLVQLEHGFHSRY